jgi:uncharacterized protein (DUF885 family)
MTLRWLLIAALISSAVLGQEPARRLHQLIDSEWERTLAASPVFASAIGDKRFNRVWPNLSPEALDALHRHDLETLAALKQIDRLQLPKADRLNYDLFERRNRERAEEYDLKWHYVPLDVRSGIQFADDISDSIIFESVKDSDDWLARLQSFPEYMNQTMALMSQGIAAHLVQPKAILGRLPAQIDKQLPPHAEDSPFYKPFRKMPAAIPEAERIRLAAAGKQVIEQRVFPAYRQMREFITAKYIPAGYDQVGIWQAPQGKELYEHFTRVHTTTTLTPAEIHEIGLREVARIKDEMYTVMRRSGFSGTLPEFFQFLRTDPRFYFKDPQDLLTAYRNTAKQIDPLLVKLFRTLPRTPYGVTPIPAHIAPDTTAAYYQEPSGDGTRAGTYFVNLYRPEARPKWEMMALSLHESVPGHHLQLALGQEQGAVPQFRRHGESFTAFIEGWGLYAESLGGEMGLYEDPYSRFGQLTYEMWRAVRLVVDTGMHSMKWDRKRAIQYFMDNAAKTELDVVNEIDRYIGWPGQALAYKIGELKIKELRKRAAAQLGPNFDVKEFHDVVLGSGTIPLDVLDANVSDWLRSKR